MKIAKIHTSRNMTTEESDKIDVFVQKNIFLEIRHFSQKDTIQLYVYREKSRQNKIIFSFGMQI